MTANGDVFAPGYVVVERGRIAAVGAGALVGSGGRTIDATGKFVTPGLIDVHSHLGVYPKPGAQAHSDGNEATDPTTPQVWAEHSVWPQDPGFQRAAEGGVTTLHILPGSANLIGGRGVTLHLRPALGSRGMRFPGAPDSLKMACGENPKRVYGGRKRSPSTRMGNVAGHRAAFLKAKAYRAKHGKAASDKMPRDLGMESLIGVLEGRVLAQVHCYRADDMLSFLQVADEMGFEVRAFHHALEAYKIRTFLAARAAAVATWADWWGFKLEANDAIQENAAFVHEAGGRSVIHSDSAEGIQRLNQEAAKAYHSGLAAGVKLEENDALRWVTHNAAWMLGIEKEVGTLEVGKRGDIVVWDAHPFSVYARAALVLVDGVVTHDVEKPVAPWSDFELGLEVVR